MIFVASAVVICQIAVPRANEGRPREAPRPEDLAYESIARSHREATPEFRGESAPLLMLSWFQESPIRAVRCQVLEGGVATNYLDVYDRGRKGGGPHHLSEADLHELDEALRTIPEGREGIARHRQVLISFHGRDEWETRIYDLQDLPFSVRDVFEIAGANVPAPSQGQESVLLHGHAVPIASMAVAADGKTLLSFDAHGTVKIWSLPDLSLVRTVHLTAPNRDDSEPQYSLQTIRIGEPPNALAAIALKRGLFACGRRNPAMFDLGTGRLVQEIDLGENAESFWCNAMALSTDEKTLAVSVSSRESHRVILWDTVAQASRGAIDDLRIPAISLAFTADGQTLAVGEEGTPGVVRYYDTITLTKRPEAFLTPFSAAKLQFADSDGVLCVAGGGTVAVARDFQDAEPFVVSANESGHSPALCNLPIEPWLASTRQHRLIKIWDRQARRRVMTLHGHAEPVTAMAATPDGRWLASGDHGGTIRFWDLKALAEGALIARRAAPPELEHLDLHALETSGRGLVHIRAHEGIRILNLWSDHVTDEALPHVGTLPKLEKLVLRHSQITDAGLANLAGLSNLKELHLHRTGIGDDGLTHLSGLTSLEVLHLHRTRVTDSGLAHLASLTSLRDLLLSDTEVTEQGLMQLKNLPRLETLRVWDTKIDDAAAERLRHSFPGVEIRN